MFFKEEKICYKNGILHFVFRLSRSKVRICAKEKLTFLKVAWRGAWHLKVFVQKVFSYRNVKEQEIEKYLMSYHHNFVFSLLIE